MIVITTEGVEDCLQGLKGMERQIPYAAANGINTTARRVKGGIYVLMGMVFDRPTPFVMNSLQMTPAKAPKKVEAQVWFKDPPNLGTKGHFLLPQVEGGARPMKPFEMGMGGRFIMPGRYTKLDQYGNLGRGMITKLLALSSGFRESGFKMNTTSAAKKKQYFRLLVKKGKLPPGIYERVEGGELGARAGRFLLARAIAKQNKVPLKDLKSRTKALLPRGQRPVVLFSGKAPSYRKRLDFYGAAEAIVNQYLYSDMEAAVAAEIAREMAYRARHGR